MDVLEVALAFAHALGWATYIGGAIAMEVLWRPAQAHIPASQVNVVCQRMGRRYRWIALAALGVIGASGAVGLLVAQPGTHPPVALTSSYGRTLLAVVAGWGVLVALVATMAVVAHPALHARSAAGLDREQRDAARLAVRRAIRRMDLMLRCELVVALVVALLGASLASGGIL